MTFYTTHGEYKNGSPLEQWTVGIKEGIAKFGLVAEPGPLLEGWVKDAGFVNVHHSVLPIPVGQWPKDNKLKELGAFDLIQFLDGLEAISLRIFTNVQGWSPNQIQVFLAEVRKDLKNTRLQAQHNLYATRPILWHYAELMLTTLLLPLATWCTHRSHW